MEAFDTRYLYVYVNACVTVEVLWPAPVLRGRVGLYRFAFATIFSAAFVRFCIN